MVTHLLGVRQNTLPLGAIAFLVDNYQTVILSNEIILLALSVSQVIVSIFVGLWL